MIELDKKILWFVSSPYTRSPRGHTGAYLDVCRLAARLHREHGLNVFSPIAHSHGMAMYGKLPVVDHDFWMSFNAPFLRICEGMLFCKMDGWDESFGMAVEHNIFKNDSKPIYYVDPKTLEISE